MDSRIVAKQIKNQIWPLLRSNGFGEFSGKSAWRHLPDQIHVVNFQSFNSYLAERIGCTTFSFALNLGIYFREIPFIYPIRKGPDPSVRPQEYHCHFRRRLLKGIEQAALQRSDTWYVEPDGSNLLDTLADARTSLQREGLPWFDRFRSLDEVLRVLTEERPPEVLFGTRQSPSRKHMIGHIARALGRNDLAEPMIAEADREHEAIRTRLNPILRRRGI